ncbi:hypothetical protein AeRB84_007439 [Aphanomyces euteiches]|nr:hypothetical protein AeRB84_007439 [Aphanomyces euteiches]
MTWKVIERRAIQIHQQDICRFVSETDSITWSQRNIVFLDEVSFDNRGMLRRRGYAMKGDKIVIRGEFGRKPRGTFDSKAFLRGCCSFAHSGKVQMHPGTNSVWILDGAKIHCNAEAILHLRSLGIVPIFLPAYCPLYNPIEYFFGYVKKLFQRSYVECRTEANLIYFVVKTMCGLKQFNMAKVFSHCGYTTNGRFDPCRGLARGKVRIGATELNDEDLGFVIRQ